MTKLADDSRKRKTTIVRDVQYYRGFFQYLEHPLGIALTDDDPPVRFAVVRSHGGDRMVLEINAETNVCQYVSRQVVVDFITSVCHKLGHEFTLLPKHANELILLWVSCAHAGAEPPAFLWADEPGVCFHRLPWNRSDPFRPTPTFDELLSRCSNREAMIAFIASLFVDKSYNQQYLWICGKGGSGKGSLIEAMDNIFGRSCFVSADVSSMEDKFWAASAVVGKRLIIFSDVRDKRRILTSGMFLSLTGGDSISVRDIGQKPVKYKPNVKIMVASNEMPTVDDSGAHQRRAIVVNIEPRRGEIDAGYRLRLIEEAGDFVRRAIDEVYPKLCPAHSPIPCSTEAIDDHLADAQLKYEEVANRLLVIHAGAECQPYELLYAVRNEFRNSYEFSKFKSWLLELKGDIHGEPLVTVLKNNDKRTLVGVRPRLIEGDIVRTGISS